MGKVFIVFVLCLFPLSAAAQFVSVPDNARSSSLGGCVPDDEPLRHVTIGYRQGFAISGMATKSVAAGWNLGSRGAVAGTYSHFGDLDYAEHQATLNCGMQVAEWLAVGVGGRYCGLTVGDGRYETQHWLAASAGARLMLGRRLTFTAMGGSRPWDEARPWKARMTLACRPVNRLLALVALESEDCWRWRMGMEYDYRQHFFFRAGMSTAPVVVAFGLGVWYKVYRIDVSVESHHTLGLTPQMTLALCF